MTTANKQRRYHDYNDHEICLDCGCPSVVALDKLKLDCPITDPETARLVLQWYKQYERDQNVAKRALDTIYREYFAW